MVGRSDAYSGFICAECDTYLQRSTLIATLRNQHPPPPPSFHNTKDISNEHLVTVVVSFFPAPASVPVVCYLKMAVIKSQLLNLWG